MQLFLYRNTFLKKNKLISYNLNQAKNHFVVSDKFHIMKLKSDSLEMDI